MWQGAVLGLTPRNTWAGRRAHGCPASNTFEPSCAFYLGGEWTAAVEPPVARVEFSQGQLGQQGGGPHCALEAFVDAWDGGAWEQVARSIAPLSIPYLMLCYAGRPRLRDGCLQPRQPI